MTEKINKDVRIHESWRKYLANEDNLYVRNMLKKRFILQRILFLELLMHAPSMKSKWFCWVKIPIMVLYKQMDYAFPSTQKLSHHLP
jgi:hypothetical protein